MVPVKCMSAQMLTPERNDDEASNVSAHTQIHRCVKIGEFKQFESVHHWIQDRTFEEHHIELIDWNQTFSRNSERPIS